jgi:molybdopterin-binding protein
MRRERLPRQNDRRDDVGASPAETKEELLELSTRNQLLGEVKSVKLGTIMAEVTVDVGGQTIVAAITRASAENMSLAVGDHVTVLIKATEVMLGK